jgi:hypothetical protein
MRASRFSLIAALAALGTCQAVAQTLPWPTDPPRAGGGAPGAQGAPGAPAAPVAPPAPMAMPKPMPMLGGAAPMGGGFAGAGAPMGGGPMGGGFGGAEPPCMPEFFRLREDVAEKSRAFKTLSERKPPSREALCKQMTLVSAAMAKWVKFTEANVASCGIPGEVGQQLKVQHEHADQMKKAVCATGPAAAPVAPSLSDALGTARLPMPETTKSGGGSTLDTLNGNILQK